MHELCLVYQDEVVVVLTLLLLSHTIQPGQPSSTLCMIKTVLFRRLTVTSLCMHALCAHRQTE